MSKRNDLLYFAMMLENARKIETFVSPVTKEQFLSHRDLPDATGLHLQRIARMAAKVSREGKSAHPEISWLEIVGLWRKIRRNEFDVDPERAWDAATIEIPPLLSALSRFVPAAPPADGTTATPGEPAMAIPHDQVAALCRKWHIKRLAFFGSFVRDDFDPNRSDVDVLVEFDEGKTPRSWDVEDTIAAYRIQ